MSPQAAGINSMTKNETAAKPQTFERQDSKKNEFATRSDSVSSDAKVDPEESQGFAKQMKDKAAGLIHDLGESEFIDKISDRAEAVDRSVRGFIQEKPLTALAIAAGAGFLAAKAFSMTSKKVEATAKKLN